MIRNYTVVCLWLTFRSCFDIDSSQHYMFWNKNYLNHVVLTASQKICCQFLSQFVVLVLERTIIHYDNSKSILSALLKKQENLYLSISNGLGSKQRISKWLFAGAAQLSFCAQSSSPIPGRIKKIVFMQNKVTITIHCIILHQICYFKW